MTIEAESRNEGGAAAQAETRRARFEKLPQLAGDGPHAVSMGGVDLVFVRTAKGPRVFQGRCPHQGALLGEGELDGDKLVCRNHRWRFSIESGQREGGPQCLAACPLVEREGETWVDISPLVPGPVPASSARGSGRALRTIRDLPGPKGLPLVGNAFEIDLRQLHLITERWAAEHGPAYVFRMGNQPTLVISDPELVAQVLRARPETYRRASKLRAVFEEIGFTGVFSAEGEAWRSQRRLAMQALSQRHLRGFYPTLHTVAQRLRGRWERAARRGDAIDIVEDLKRFTVDVTTSLAFGYDVNTIEQSQDDVIQRRLELLFPAFSRRIFALFPVWRLIRLPRDRKLDRALAELRTWLDGLVAEGRARLKADPARAERPSNFLEAMLTARDEAGQPFPDQVIFGNLLTMLLAGEDTTAYTLAWAIHHLCDSPASVAALRSELDAVLGAHALPGELDIANRLRYAGAVANEAMRMRPVAPLLFFESLVDTTLGDLEIPAQTPMLVLTRPAVLDPARFDEPATFRPERWIEANAERAHDPSVHVPFGSGPRICPGRSLALLEMNVVLALVYKSFDVARRGAPGDVRELFSFTMEPVNLRVELALRKGAVRNGADRNGAEEHAAVEAR